MKTKKESKKELLTTTPEELYNYLSDFRNFESILPKNQIADWQSDGERCSFKAQGSISFALEYVTKQAYTKIVVGSVAPTPIEFFLAIDIEEINVGGSAIVVSIEADLNPMMKTMVGGQLQKVVDALAVALKQSKG